MNAIEQRARQLLADQYASDGLHQCAQDLRSGRLNAELGWVRDAERAIKAIAAALTPPEGFVLVPVEPTDVMIAAAEEAHMPFGDMGFAISAALAARPEMP